MFQLKREQLLRQQRQVINNAYTHISYILQECKPFLSGYILGKYDLLKTQKRFQFQTLAKESVLGGLDPIRVPLSDQGRWVVFPVGEFDISEESVILDTELEDGLSKSEINVELLRKYIENQSVIQLVCTKIYTLEFNMFKSVEGSLKNTFKSLIKDL